MAGFIDRVRQVARKVVKATSDALGAATKPFKAGSPARERTSEAIGGALQPFKPTQQSPQTQVSMHPAEKVARGDRGQRPSSQRVGRPNNQGGAKARSATALNPKATGRLVEGEALPTSTPVAEEVAGVSSEAAPYKSGRQVWDTPGSQAPGKTASQKPLRSAARQQAENYRNEWNAPAADLGDLNKNASAEEVFDALDAQKSGQSRRATRDQRFSRLDAESVELDRSTGAAEARIGRGKPKIPREPQRGGLRDLNQQRRDIAIDEERALKNATREGRVSDKVAIALEDKVAIALENAEMASVPGAVDAKTIGQQRYTVNPEKPINVKGVTRQDHYADMAAKLDAKAAAREAELEAYYASLTANAEAQAAERAAALRASYAAEAEAKAADRLITPSNPDDPMWRHELTGPQNIEPVPLGEAPSKLILFEDEVPAPKAAEPPAPPVAKVEPPVAPPASVKELERLVQDGDLVAAHQMATTLKGQGVPVDLNAMLVPEAKVAAEAPVVAPKAAEPPAPPKAAEPPAPPKAAEPPAPPKAAEPPAAPKAAEPPAPPKAAEPPAPPKASEPPAPPKASEPPAPPKASEPPAELTVEAKGTGKKIKARKIKPSALEAEGEIAKKASKAAKKAKDGGSTAEKVEKAAVEAAEKGKWGFGKVATVTGLAAAAVGAGLWWRASHPKKSSSGSWRDQTSQEPSNNGTTPTR